MKTIFNQHFINLDHLLDIDQLLEMKPKISSVIANNPHFMRPTKYDGNLSNIGIGLIDAVRNIKENIDSLPNRELLSQMIQNDTLGTYLLFEQNIDEEGSFSIALQYEKDDAVLETTLKNKFQFIYDWLDSQNIFEKYTRSGFFITWKDTSTVIHRDWNNNDAEPWHSLHINFTEHKKLFLIDPESEEKIYLTGHCNWFDTRNFHGTDPATRSCYSFRVIGKFTDQFLEKVKSQYVNTL